MLKRRGFGLVIAVLIGFGAWNLGQAAYIHAKARLAQHLLQAAWAQTQAGQPRVKPWPWADTYPVARLTMPARKVDLIVLAGASGRTLAFGPGHLDGTALPGETGNSVLSAHRDTHFAFLRHARPGDDFFIEGATGTPARFVVTETRVVDQRDISLLRATPDRQITLVTCYPFDAVRPGGPLRYVVVARPVAAITPCNAAARSGCVVSRNS